MQFRYPSNRNRGGNWRAPVFALAGLGMAVLVLNMVAGANNPAGTAEADRAVQTVGAISAELESREPGLLLRLIHIESQSADTRVARLLALHVPLDEPPSPFLELGPFEAAWEGWLEVEVEDAYTFHFVGNGRAEVAIGSARVLETDGEAESEPIRLTEGTHPLQVRYRAPEIEPARMRLLWSSSQFGPEPISPMALSHDGSDVALDQSVRLRQGRLLFAEHRCLKCHEPGNERFFDETSMPELSMDAPSLMEVGSRLRAGWVRQWIENPRAVRPSARMPHLVTGEEAADIAAYLGTLGARPEPVKLTDSARISEGGRLYAVHGCVACHTFDPPVDGSERLSLVDVKNKWHESALVNYLRKPAQHYGWTPMPDFQLSESEAAALGAFLLDRSKPAAESRVNGDAVRGAELVQQRGCANCHEAPVRNLLAAPSLEELMHSDWRGGCLAEPKETGGKAPRLALSASEREALQAFAREGFDSLQRRSSVEFAARQVRSLDCRACHKMDGQMDRWSQRLEEVVHLLPEADDNPRAQRRPNLTWIGEKLQPDWLEKVLAGKLDRAPRPWMEARMPGVGARPELLATGLLATHGIEAARVALGPADPQLVSRGRSLATGIGGGFWCHSCHGASGGGAPSIELGLIGERLQPEFFHWKMRTPQRVDPESPMPQFADAKGRTRLRDILGGDAQRQFEAIWHFMLDSRADRVAARGEQDQPVEWRPGWADHYKKMDTGPFYSGVIEVPGGGRLDKGLAIRVGEQRQATVHFDTDLLRMSAGWTGEFITFRSHEDYGTRNSPPPLAAGEVRFVNPEVAGWTGSADGRFSDTRGRPRAFGPIPEEQGRYQGLYRHGHRVALAYTVRGTPVRESPWHIENGQTGAFVRDLKIGRHDEPLSVLLFQSEAEVKLKGRGALQIAWAEEEERVTAAAIGAASGIELAAIDGQVAVRFEPGPVERRVRVWIWEGNIEQLEAFFALAVGAAEPDDLDQLVEPGPALWGEPLRTKGQLGKAQRGYAVDMLTAPQENPFHALLHFTGIDFLPDGRAVLSTMHGDVWLVDGIDEPLEGLSWQRFATGLNKPFGVRVVGGKIYVSGEDELTILHDRNGNGEADYYQNFHNLIAPGAGAWRQAFGLEVDSEGNFYFARGRGRADQSNGIVRISSDGRKMEVIATGFRQPFGIGISPQDRVTVSQQEGTWVPQTPVHKIDLESRKGSFYGYDPRRNRKEDPYPRALGYEPPLVWLPRDVDNSGGGQVWVDSDLWGLPRGQMLHLSYGQGTLLQLFHEEVNGDRQGGVAPVVRFRRVRPRAGRFHPQDGQLYVAGISPGGGFERVRHTGEKAHLPVALGAYENGLRLAFNHPLDPSAATNVSNYTVHQWNYRWSEGYGSEFYSVKNPAMLGEDPVEVLSARLIENGREIFLEIQEMVPVMQMRITYELKAGDGTMMKEEIHNTIHGLRPAFNHPGLDSSSSAQADLESRAIHANENR
jgi:mono/diheme cytochrome c family protein